MLQRYEISGMSMSPTFQPGDRVVVRSAAKISVGDIVVLKNGGLTMIKRLQKKSGTRWHVRGDNLAESTDSLDYGDVDEQSIVGKVIFQY